METESRAGPRRIRISDGKRKVLGLALLDCGPGQSAGKSGKGSGKRLGTTTHTVLIYVGVPESLYRRRVKTFNRILIALGPNKVRRLQQCQFEARQSIAP